MHFTHYALNKQIYRYFIDYKWEMVDFYYWKLIYIKTIEINFVKKESIITQ